MLNSFYLLEVISHYIILYILGPRRMFWFLFSSSSGWDRFCCPVNKAKNICTLNYSLIVVVYVYHSLNRGLTVKGTLCPVCNGYIPLWCDIFATKVSSSVIRVLLLGSIDILQFYSLIFSVSFPRVENELAPPGKWQTRCNACWIYFLNLCSFLYMLNTRVECCRLVCGRCSIWILAGTYPDKVFLVFLIHCRKIPQ